MESDPSSRTPRRANDLGPIGHQVGRNVEAIREDRRLTQKELAARMTALGRPMTMQMVSKIEQGERRVDSDDLTTAAIALGVNVSALMLPRGAARDEVIELTPVVRRRAGDAWMWMDGLRPLPGEGGHGPTFEDRSFWVKAADFQRHARPQGDTTTIGPMAEAIFALLRMWEIAYLDWADPETFTMRAADLERELKRLTLQSEGELERLRREGSAAERRRLAEWQADHRNAEEQPIHPRYDEEAE